MECFNDEVNYVKIGLGNFYHEICHRYIHGGDEISRFQKAQCLYIRFLIKE